MMTTTPPPSLPLTITFNTITTTDAIAESDPRPPPNNLVIHQRETSHFNVRVDKFDTQTLDSAHHVVVVGGQKSGKTTLALNLLQHMAKEYSTVVVITEKKKRTPSYLRSGCLHCSCTRSMTTKSSLASSTC